MSKIEEYLKKLFEEHSLILFDAGKYEGGEFSINTDRIVSYKWLAKGLDKQKSSQIKDLKKQYKELEIDFNNTFRALNSTQKENKNLSRFETKRVKIIKKEFEKCLLEYEKKCQDYEARLQSKIDEVVKFANQGEKENNKIFADMCWHTFKYLNDFKEEIFPSVPKKEEKKDDYD